MDIRIPVTTAMMMLLAAGAAGAGEGHRCGNYIVSSDMTVKELLQKCGEPTSRKVTEEDVRAANARGGTRKVGTASVEVWTYDRGSNAFKLVVTIVDGRIMSIVSEP